MNTIRFTFLFVVISQYCDAQYWQPLQAGLNNGGSTKLYTDSVADKLYVGGHFTLVNNQTQWGIASWNGTQWDSLGCGMDDLSIGNQPGSTSGMVRYGNHLYAGGSFRIAGGLNTPALARWDGISWDTVPGVAMDQMDLVHDIIVYNNELYICGSFDSVGNSPASCVAKWDGTNWQAIGSYSFSYSNAPMNLYKIQFYHGNLYVIGEFFDPWGNVCRMAKWMETFSRLAVIKRFTGPMPQRKKPGERDGKWYANNCPNRWKNLLWAGQGRVNIYCLLIVLPKKNLA